ncbi:MAG: transketolase C-terminal domain-containing protein [Acidimicrobiia bacterium]
MQPYEQLLATLMDDDDRIVVMTAENRAALRALPDHVGDRFIDVGIAEQTMIGAAAGLALRGRVPIVHALSTFLTLRAFEFIRTDVGIPALPVKLVGAVPGFLSDGNGPTHQAIEDIALMWGIPDMGIFAPADEDELLEGLPAVIADPRPWYIRFIGLPGRIAHTEPFALGSAETLREGDDVAILSYGFCVGLAVGAADRLAAHGIGARVVNLRTIAPLDREAVLAACDLPLVVTVEDHFLHTGLAAILATVLLEERRTADVLPIGLPTWFRPGTLDRVLEHAGFTPDQLADRIRHRLEEA